MEAQVLQYRIIISPDEETGTGKSIFTALSPLLGVADSGDTKEEALENVKLAIQAYVDSLIEDGLPVPKEFPSEDIITVTQIPVTGNLQFA